MPNVRIGENSGDDFHGTEDAFLKQASPTNNNGGSSEVEVSYWGENDNSPTLIRFTGLSNLPASITVSASSINLYCTRRSDGSRTATVKRILRNWVEGARIGDNRSNDSPYSCCWNEYGGGNAWTSHGGLSDGNDRASAVSATMAMTATGYMSASGSQLNTDIENIASGVYANDGDHIERTDGSADYVFDVFASSEGTNGERPYLSVTYTESGGSSIVPIIVSMNHFNGGM